MRIEGHKKELSRIRILESKKLPMPSNSQIKLKSEKITSEFSNYQSLSNSERAHRRLNAFVHIYKDKLQLKDPGQELSSEAIPVDLSIINYDKY